MTETVMDASAVLASLNGEPGAEVVDAALAGSMVSAVNFAEVVSKLIVRGMPEVEAAEAVRLWFSASSSATTPVTSAVAIESPDAKS